MAKLIGKLIYMKDVHKKVYRTISYDMLNCEVENVGYYKDTIVTDSYVAFDIPSGLMVCKTKYKKDLANEVNKLKEKIELARNKENYVQKVQDLQNAIIINKNTNEEDN